MVYVGASLVVPQDQEKWVMNSSVCVCVCVHVWAQTQGVFGWVGKEGVWDGHSSGAAFEEENGFGVGERVVGRRYN